MEDHPQVLCPYDHLLVTADKNKDPTPLCGNTLPHNITSAGNSMHIEFVTDDSGNYKGFKAFYDTHGMYVLGKRFRADEFQHCLIYTGI